MKHLRRGSFLGTFMLGVSMRHGTARQPSSAPTSPAVQFGTTQAPLSQPQTSAASNPLAALGPPVILWLRGQGASVEDLEAHMGWRGGW